MNHALVFPSFTDSTVVFATPAKSPPQNTCGSFVCWVVKFTSGNFHLFSGTGESASITVIKNLIKMMREIQFFDFNY